MFQNSSVLAMTFIACGIRATIPAMMMRDAPFPTPNSVMSSPSHMTAIAPAMRERTTIKPSPNTFERMLAVIISGCIRKTPV